MSQGGPNFEVYARKLTDPNLSPANRLQLATEIRDNIEIVHTAEYKNFLQHLFTVFYQILKAGQPQFNDGTEQKIRNIILEILNRLPSNDILRPYVPNLMKLAMHLLEHENEENAVICLRIIIDLHKTYRPSLENEVQPFLEIVMNLYKELPVTVTMTFKEKPQAAIPPPQPNQAFAEPPKATSLIRSMQSFKVLTECPIIVVLLFQLYPRFLAPNIIKFTPLIINTLGLQAPRNAKVTHKTAYVDLIAAQVKTLSFLAYMLRGFAEHLKPYQENIPKGVIQLLINCPSESAAMRKELLIATRHILATDFRTGFISQIDHLLDEKILIGSGRTSYETLRPLAYSTLADLIHHVRTELSLAQLLRVFHLYSRNIHDPTLQFAIQTMSAKLLLNLVECISKKNEADGKGRLLLIRILDAFVNKFSSLKKSIPKLVSGKAAKDSEANIKDCRLLMKTLVLGLKNIVWGVSSCTPNYRAHVGGPSGAPLSPEESIIFIALLKNGLKCFPIYSSGPNPSLQEEKDILDHFAAVFTMVDTRIFQDVFSTQMNYLYERIMENQAISAIPQHFLVNPGVSKLFVDILLNFLIDHMKELSGKNQNASAVLLKLFELVFTSVTLLAENEAILQPHLPAIITSAMKHASEVRDSINYFSLLRNLFRTIGGKFDLFYKDFLPILPALLEWLNRLQNSFHSQTMRDLFIELALTVPVRPSALMPCIRSLMKPLLLALEGNTELAFPGLRILELCVENLSSDFLDPVVSEVKGELMMALWKHLKPNNYPHGAQALRILGRLAQRNRQFLKDPLKLKIRENTEDGLVIPSIFEPNLSINLSMDRYIIMAKQKLVSSPDLDIKKQSFAFLQLCLNGLLYERDRNPIDSESSVTYRVQRQLAAQNAIFKTLLDAVLIANATEKLSETMTDYFDQICRHFAIVFSTPKKPQDLETTSGIFIEALVDALTNENRSWAKSAVRAFDILYETWTILTGGTMDAAVSLEFNELAKKLSHCCYRSEWYMKSGACYGISHMCSKLPSTWVLKNEVLFVRSLIFMLKDLPSEVSLATMEEASSTLTAILKICNPPDLDQIARMESFQAQTFTEVVGLLASELSTANITVRENVQAALKLLSQNSKTELNELLEPFKGALLSPIFAKPLRSLPIMTQTGYMDALTFCLNLRPPLLSFTPELVRLLQGALAIAEKEDISSGKTLTPKSLQMVNSLRTVSIELLSAAMGCPDFQGQENQDFRNRIMGVFFKALTLRSSEIVAVAKKGLAQVIHQKNLPKELLQSSLRPVLLNLADYRKLSVPLLQGLARLLELLTNCFNVTLGEKLLEHLNNWTDPSKLQIASTKLWKDGEEIRIAAAIIEIFHLLPPAAVKFLEQLVMLTVNLETLLPREIPSPYRVPLIKFLNRYPVVSVEYFLHRLSQPPYSKLFRALIREETAGPLRDELGKNLNRFISSTFLYNNPQVPALEVQFQGILLIRALTRFNPEWLSYPNNRPLINCLIDLWKSPNRINRLTNDETLSLQHLRESKLIIKCFLNYCNYHREEVDLLFHMLSIFTYRTTIDYTFLKDFYAIEVAEHYSPSEKKNILLRFLQFFREPGYSQEHKVRALRVLVIPMLNASFVKNDYTDTIDQRIIAAIIAEILEPKVGETYEEALNIELLQLATILVRFMPTELVEHRKELIKFAWSHLRSEDTTTRQCAYVLVCRFIEAYDTPPKIILQVYVALLRAFQPEARSLVQQALDILLLALHKRLPVAGNDRYPTWIKWTKKIIVEEGHSLPQLTHIFQLIVRHPQLFFAHRGHFVPHMVNALARIGLLPNSPYENRKLAVDLADLIIKWEKQRINEGSGPEVDINNNSNSVRASTDMISEDSSLMDLDNETPAKKLKTNAGTPTQPPQQTPVEPEFKANSTVAEIIVNFFVRIASAITDGESSNLPNEAADLLKDVLTLWPDALIKFPFFEKLLSNSPADQPALVSTGLHILNIIVDFQLQKFVDSLVSRNEASNSMQNCFAPIINCSNPKIVGNFCILLTKMIKHYPLTAPAELAGFYNFIGETIENNLNNIDKSNVQSLLTVLKTISADFPDYLDRYLSSLIKIIQKLAKEHTGTRDSKEVADIRISMANPSIKKQAKDSASNLFSAITLVNCRCNQLPPENRKLFFACLLNLTEKCLDPDLLIDIMKMVIHWVNSKDPNAPVLTSKEKVQFLLKMIRFDQQGNATLQALFLELVYHIYSDPSCKSESAQLEIAFMMGLRSKDSAVRNKFFEHYNQGIEKKLLTRFDFIFSVQNWETMGSSFWLKQAIDLLLATLSPRSTFRIETKSDISMKPAPEYPTSEESRKISANHEDFMSNISDIKVSDIFLQMRDLYHQDTEMASILWIQLFPLCWALLNDQQKDKFSKVLTVFLTKEYHAKHLRNPPGQPNVIQSILEGVTVCRSPPKIPVELLKFLGKTYNAWYSAIKLLENHLSGAAEEQMIESAENKFDLCLAELFQLLSEDDLHYTIWRRKCVVEDSKAGLILEQFGQWHKAQEVYFNVMNKAQTSARSASLSPAEICMWEEHWLECSKRLTQWELLTEFARAQSHTDLLLECAWKVPDWNAMKEALTKVAPTDSATFKLYQSYTAFHDGKAADVESLGNQATQLALKHWQTLPELPAVAHIPTLQVFQQIVELKESFQIYKDINGPNKVQSLPDVKSTLSIWRERLPNPWEDILVWNDLLTWRQHVFSLINTAYASLPQENNNNTNHLGHHETAWTINKFGHIARKHGLIEVCLHALPKIYSLPNIEIQDAFLKLREQVKSYFHTHYRTGLDIINSTNLEYFTPQQKAEFFQLKGEFLAKMGQNEDAHSAFSTSLTISDNLARGWLSWGLFCDHQYEDSSDITWAEYALTCFLNAIRCGSNRGRRMLARVFWLLSFEDDAENRLIRAFEKYSENLPVWIYINWIPQLLSSLAKPEGPQMKNILLKLATVHPQAMYFTLRTFLFEKREMNGPFAPNVGEEFGSSLLPKAGAVPGRLPVKPPNAREEKGKSANALNLLNARTRQIALKYAEEILACLKATHAALSSDLDLIIKEIGTGFQLELEESLLVVLKTLLNQCYKLPPTTTANVLPESIKDKVETIYQRTFSNYISSAAPTPSMSKKFPEFVAEYKASYETDFLKETNLSNMIEKLKRWVKKLQATVDRLPKKLNLEDICPATSNPGLLDYQANSIEIPGQYFGENEPATDFHVRLERFHSEVRIVGTQRYLQVRGNNGKLYPFQVVSIPNIPFVMSDRSEEQILQLLRTFSTFLNKSKEIRKRQVHFNIPNMIPFSPRLRLVQSEIDFVSLANVEAEFSADRDPWLPLDYYRKNVAAGPNMKQEIFNAITKTIPDTILAQYIRAMIPSYMHLFAFKKQFASQLALTSFLGYILGVGNRTPDNISFLKTTGTILQSNFYLDYTDEGAIKIDEPVPFRLTRNIQNFLNPLFVDGTFNAVMTSATFAFSNYKDQLRHHLAILLRDDFMAWQISEKFEPSAVDAPKVEQETKKRLKAAVENNTNGVLDRIKNLTLPPQPEKTGFTVPINKKVTELIAAAQDPQTLASMDPTWHAWF